MTKEAQGRQRGRSKLWIAALALTILVSIIVIPPLVSINRYKSRIAQAMSNSLGRPVHLSAVELRLLPRPGFVITDLTVEEDPSYGAEPVLHANTVTASIRLLSLWRGRLEISRISVDEASLNLVRTTGGSMEPGHTLSHRGAASSRTERSREGQFHCRILKRRTRASTSSRDIEKLPYSLVNADLSFWEEEPGRLARAVEGAAGAHRREPRSGRYRNRATGRPHAPRAGVAADAGACRPGVARGATGPAQPAADRIDPGWRGDLTAEMKLDGTADSAQVTTRLRASGVHRAEFAPAAADGLRRELRIRLSLLRAHH